MRTSGSTCYKSEQPSKKGSLHLGCPRGSDTFETCWEPLCRLALEIPFWISPHDLVHGIGIYPGQETELTIKHLRAYAPSSGRCWCIGCHADMKIIVSPINYDVVWVPSRSPCLPWKFPKTASLSKPGTSCACRVCGCSCTTGALHRHHRGDSRQFLSQERADDEEMLVRRHLAPADGRRMPLPREDPRRPPPRCPHQGHHHLPGLERQCGTWQFQTKFQKDIYVNPTPVLAVVVDLQTLGARDVQLRVKFFIGVSEILFPFARRGRVLVPEMDVRLVQVQLRFLVLAHLLVTYSEMVPCSHVVGIWFTTILKTWMAELSTCCSCRGGRSSRKKFRG